MMFVMSVGRLIIIDRRARHHNPGRADWRRDIDRRRANNCRLTDDYSVPRQWQTDANADVDPGLSEGHSTHENRCN